MAAHKSKPNRDALVFQDYALQPQSLCKNIGMRYTRVMEFTVIA